MNDMRAVIVPKSDQINADDLLSGPMTITITAVTIRPGTEQPVSINFEGDGGKCYRPCKSMARVMVACWGPDANQYKGRSMTLYCDPKVKWGGMEVGGIRISHMTHINGTQTMALTATKGSKKPFTVQPLREKAPPTSEPPKRTIASWLAELDAELTEVSADPTAVDAIIARQDVQDALVRLRNGALTKLVTLIQTYNPAWNPPTIENAPENEVTA